MALDDNLLSLLRPSPRALRPSTRPLREIHTTLTSKNKMPLTASKVRPAVSSK